MKKICVMINVKDRPTEIGLLVQSLRTQTIQDFDIIILDDNSGTHLTYYHFLNCLFNILKMEGHNIILERTEFTHGVSRARQRIVDIALKENYELFLRVDDDCILESDYIERLLKVIDQGYDIATGVTIPCAPAIERDPKYLKGIINRCIIDNEGNFILNGDDCGMPYTKSEILPAHHFRSCALMKRAVHERVKYYPTKMNMHGFREEQLFSFKALLEGFKIGCDTKAVNYHQMTPSGGERSTQTNENTLWNQKVLEDFTKSNKDALSPIFPVEPKISDLELTKQTNLLMK